MAALTRGSLPPGIYWRRRLFVLGLAAAVLTLVAGLVRGIGGPEPDDGVAQQAAADPSASAEPTDDATDTSAGSDKSDEPGKSTKSDKPKGRKPLPEPQGDCSPSDVVVEPKVGRSVAGRDVAMILKLRTEFSEACTFDLSAKKLTMTISSGSDEIWASRQCPRAVPEKTLVLRQEPVSRVRLAWNAKRSDEGCTRLTQWALPGWYHVAAAALGGEPTTVKFELETPEAAAQTDDQPKQGQRKRSDKTDQNTQGSETDSGQKPRKKADEDLHRTERR